MTRINCVTMAESAICNSNEIDDKFIDISDIINNNNNNNNNSNDYTNNNK